MQSLFHSLHIGTLSAWMSVVGFGAVGVSIAPWQAPAPPEREKSSITTEILPSEFVLQQVDPGPGADLSPSEPSPDLASASAEPLPAPPALEPLPESAPLPDIPDLPPLPPETPDPPVARSNTSSSSAARSASPPDRRSTSGASSSRSSSRSSQGGSGSGTSGSGGGASATSRLAAGRMPAPTYPTSSKRKGETGSVTVSFTIGTDGKVISAYASSPSPYPALNEAAVRAVRRWKFPPGGILKTQRRLDFVLK